MAIPASILSDVKSLLRISDSSRDAAIQQVYEKVLRELVRTVDWLVEKETIDAEANRSTYESSPRAIRLINVVFSKTQLWKSVSKIFDYLRESWQGQTSGTPEYWWQDKIPSAVAPETFTVYPPPSSSATGEDAFVTLASMIPQGDDPAPKWLDAYLTYRTASEYMKESAEERIDRQDTALMDFYDRVAELWWQVLAGRLP